LKWFVLFRIMTIIVPIGLSGCGESWASDELNKAASDILRVSEACLYDVRDHQIKYEASNNCNALRGLSDRYIDEGGYQDGTPAEIKLKYAHAQKVAWMALALSVSNGEANRIW